MGSPAGVCNADVGVKDLCEVWLLLLNQGLELSDLSDLLEGIDLVSLVAIYGKTGGVIATVLETGETC